MKQQNTKHKRLGVVITYVIVFGFKYIYLRKLCNVFGMDKNSLSTIGNVESFFPFVLLKKGNLFVSLLKGKKLCQAYIQ